MANLVLLITFVTTKLPLIDGTELVFDKLTVSPILTLLGVDVVTCKFPLVTIIDVMTLLPIFVSVFNVMSPFPVFIV